MKYRLAIFDFDGTLANTFPFFVRVFDQLAGRHGFKALEPSEVEELRQLDAKGVMKHVGLPTWKLPFVAKDFISLMKEDLAAVELFEGIDDALARLTKRGVSLAIVSSNSYANVTTVLGAETSRRFHHFECGASIFGKAARLEKVLKKLSVPSHEVIYIGDQISDLEAAHEAGIAFGAVGWGYGTLESLRDCSPEEVFESVRGLKEVG